MKSHRSNTYTAAALAVALLTFPAAALSAQSVGAASQMKEDKAGQLAKAKVTPDAARRTALARVPQGVILEQGIEEEGGKLVFSFDIRVPGKTGIEEVLIDARSGTVVSQEHETPAKVAAEKTQDAKEAKAAAKVNTKKPPR